MNKNILITSTVIILTFLGSGCSAPAATNKESSPRYMSYSKAAYAAASGKKRVYFFHAKWCPSCIASNAVFNASPDKIPEDVVVFKTDYDTETELKNKYGITYQHTFVQVDASGKEMKKWNGGDLAELKANIQ